MLPDDEFLYEGGECKSSNTRISTPQCLADKHRNLGCSTSIEETNQVGRCINELGFRAALSLFDEIICATDLKPTYQTSKENVSERYAPRLPQAEESQAPRRGHRVVNVG